MRLVINQIKLRPRVAAGEVKRRIKAALHRQARIEADQVRVSVDGGKVALEGKVDAWSDRYPSSAPPGPPPASSRWSGARSDRFPASPGQLRRDIVADGQTAMTRQDALARRTFKVVP